MDAAPLAPLSEYEERHRMAARLQMVWPGALTLTLASAVMVHQLGFSGLGLVLGPALGGLLLTLAAVLQARRPRQPGVPSLPPTDPALPSTAPQTA